MRTSAWWFGFMFVGLSVALSVAACSTPEPSSSNAGTSPDALLASSASSRALASPIVLSPQTIVTDELKNSFQKHLSIDQDGRQLTVSPNMLTVALVTRPRAEMRQGPGGQYELLDVVLPQDTKVLVMDQTGVWRKIVVRDTWQRGWVHYQALSKPVSSGKPLTLSASLLPTVITIKQVTKIFSFPKREPLAVQIPKGVVLKALRRDEFGYLVWLATSTANSVAWLADRDVQ